jgi:hypothetical protein
MSSSTINGSATVIGNNFLAKGTITAVTSATTATQLHTLNVNWSPSQKFAFECSLFGSASTYTSYAGLWDFTAGSVVSASQVSTTSTTATLVRSGQFTLIPGHVYGVTVWVSATGTLHVSKAHLVAFLS